MIKNRLVAIKNMPLAKKIFMYAILILYLMIIAFVVGLLFGGLKGLLSFKLDFGAVLSKIIVGLTKGIWLTLLLYIVTVCIFLFSLSKKYESNEIHESDERGVSFLQNSTYGSSRWLTTDEAKNIFNVGNIQDTFETVYGQFTDNGKMVCSFKDINKGGNRNNLILGSPGTGKSFAFVRTELIQSILRGDSFVVTDPSGELYTSIAGYCEAKGVEVKVLNLSTPERSNAWNCLRETIDEETERLNGTRLNEFADIYMKNTSTGSEDGFWYTASLNLIKMMIGYCAWKRETEILEGLNAIFKKILAFCKYSDKDISDAISPYSSKLTSIKEYKNYILKIATVNGYKEKEIKKYFEEVEKAATPFDIGQVVYLITTMGKSTDLSKYFDSIPLVHPCALAYKNYMLPDISDQVRASARQGVMIRFQLFADKTLRTIMSHDDIDLSSINKKQTACFVITPDKSDAMKPISSLFFSFLFKDASETWDKAQAEAEQLGKKNEIIPVTVMCDEFYSIGMIPSFPIFIATCRKRLLNVSCILQGIGQVYELYGENGGTTIQTCCDTIIFLGCNDEMTAKFISNFASGEATVLTQRREENTGILSGMKSPMEMLSVSEGKRNVLTVGEARQWKNKVLVVKRGEHPLKLNPFGYIEHPAYINNELTKKSVFMLPNINDVYVGDDAFRELTVGTAKNGMEARKEDKSTIEKIAEILINPPALNKDINNLDDEEVEIFYNIQNEPPNKPLEPIKVVEPPNIKVEPKKPSETQLKPSKPPKTVEGVRVGNGIRGNGGRKPKKNTNPLPKSSKSDSKLG